MQRIAPECMPRIKRYMRQTVKSKHELYKIDVVEEQGRKPGTVFVDVDCYTSSCWNS